MDIPIWCLAHVTSRQPVPSAAPPHTHGRRRIGGGLALTGSRSASCGLPAIRVRTGLTVRTSACSWAWTEWGGRCPHDRP